MPDLRSPILSVRLPAWQRRATYGVVGALVVTGLGWLAAHYLLTAKGDFGIEEHPMAHWALVAHGISAYGVLWLWGALWPAHMRMAWRLGRNRFTGLVMVTTMSLLSVSGLWLYYGSTGGRDAVSLLHWLVGLASAPALVWHIVTGKK